MRNTFLLLFILFFFACGKKEAPSQRTKSERPIPVRIVPVQREAIDLSIKSSGIVTSNNEAKPAFKTGGIVAQILAKEGYFVKKGQLLARLDLTEINAQVQQATEAVTKSKRDLQRVQNLYADSVATLENVQDATTGLSVSEQQLKMAEFNQSYSEIRSPIAGKVIKQIINKGEVVGPGMPAFFILGNSARDWVIESGLADRDWARVEMGDQATVKFDAYPGKEFIGKITQLADMGNPGSGTFDVEISLTNNPPRLAAGLIASVDIFPKSDDSQSVIPLDALLETEGTSAKIFTIKNGVAHLVKITVAFLQRDMAIISSGLDEVENVVTDGAAYLIEGAKVEVVE